MSDFQDPADDIPLSRNDAFDAQGSSLPSNEDLPPAPASSKKLETHHPRGTSVSLLFSGVIALVVTIIFFIIVEFALRNTYVHDFFMRSRTETVVPFCTILLFVWAIVILIRKTAHVRRERGAFVIELLPCGQYDLIQQDDVHSLLRQINGMPAEQQNLYLVTRVWRALKRLRAAGDTNEVDDILEYQATIDAASVESTYAAVKIFIWAIPVIGFIGTVLGISTAIGGFGALVQNADDMTKIREGLSGVTGSLSTAFETTLLALVCSIIVMFLSTYVRKREDDLLTEVEDHCIEHLINKLAIGDDRLVSNLNEAFAESQEEAMKKQAEVIESALVELQSRQEKMLAQFNSLFDQKHVEALEKMTQSLRECFDDATAQQAMRMSEMSQRMERGLREMGEGLKHFEQKGGGPDPDATIDAPMMMKGGEHETPAPPQNEDLMQAFSNQAEELRQTREAIAKLGNSLEHLATLKPFEAVMANIQTALDALVPAIDELAKPRELRIIDGVPGTNPGTKPS